MAWYGNVALVRAWCNDCQQMALIVDGAFACCDRGFAGDRPTEHQRMIEAPPIRRLPPREERRKVLAEQGNCCIYCERTFGTFRRYHGRIRRLSLVWDHFVPWSHMRSNETRNFVAACSLCNAIKSNMIFNTIQEVRDHVEKAYNPRRAEVPEMSQDVCDEEIR